MMPEDSLWAKISSLSEIRGIEIQLKKEGKTMGVGITRHVTV